MAIVKVSIGTEWTGAAGRAATTPVDAGVSFQGPTATAGNWQVTQSLLRVLFEIFLRLELVLQQFGKVTHILSRCGLPSAHRFEKKNYYNFLPLSELNHKITYSSAVFLHGVRHLVVFVFTPFASEEASLAHVEVEALQAAVTKPANWRLKNGWIKQNSSFEQHPEGCCCTCLQMLHLAACLADSAATKRCRTGSHTILCGSCFIHPKKLAALVMKKKYHQFMKPNISQYVVACYDLLTSINCLSPVAFSKQLLTEGSTLLPPKAASSPSTRGIWIQSCSSRPNFLSVALRCWSAISRNMSKDEIEGLH